MLHSAVDPVASGFNKNIIGGFNKDVIGGFNRDVIGGFNNDVIGGFNKDVIGGFDRDVIGGFNKDVIGGFDNNIIDGSKSKVINPGQSVIRNEDTDRSSKDFKHGLSKSGGNSQDIAGRSGGLNYAVNGGLNTKNGLTKDTKNFKYSKNRKLNRNIHHIPNRERSAMKPTHFAFMFVAFYFSIL